MTTRFVNFLPLVMLALGAVAAHATDDGRDIITSELDTREYRYIEFDNGLRAVLVSDPETDKSAASLDVAVGHGSDPEGRQGLAHFLEHMLFLGTEKYPEAGAYQEFIKDHGGSHNAYTSYDHTNYFFSVQPDFLEGALDRFSQFFVAPLFNEDLVKRERVIVHSEYSARSEGEGRRTWAARRQAMNPGHPRSNFAVGSLETLADREGSPVRDDLIEFYHEHYSAHLMTLSVLGRQSLDELEKLVRERFADVRRTDAVRFIADVPLYDPEKLPSMLKVKPLKSHSLLTFTFEVPSTLDVYDRKPLHQVSNILGHEGEGSLLAALKARGWADALSAGPGLMDAGGGTLEVNIDLTEAGVDHVRDIGAMLFRTIRLIEEQGVERWRFDEQKALAEMSFRYGETRDPMRLVQTIADGLHDLPWREVLHAPYAFDEFDANLVREFLGFLRPEHAVVTLVAPGVETDRTDPWYGTEFAIEPLDPSLVAAWREPERYADLALPSPNPFVPENLSMVSVDERAEAPVKIVDTPELGAWHQTVTRFGAPRAEFYVSFRSPRAMDSARNAALSDLYTEVIKDRLNTFSYPAALAGLGYEVYPHLRGFSLRISGFSDRQPKLLERISSSLRVSEVDEARFGRLRAALLEDYRNRLKDSPSRLAVSELQRLLIESATPLEERIEALESVTAGDFRSFIEAFFERGNAVVLSVGNRRSEDARAMAEVVRNTVLAGVEPLDVSRGSVVRLEPAKHYQRRIEARHSDSVVGLYIQGSEDSYAERARFFLYDQLSNSAFYHRLRTEQKLGYIVQSFAMPIIDVPGMMFLVQSPTASPETTEAAIRDFIGGFADSLGELDAERLERAKDALLSQINRRDETLSDLADRYWREIDEREFGFDSRQRLSRAVKDITIEDMRAFTNRVNGEASGSLVIRSSGGTAPDGGDAAARLSKSEIVDPADFKRGHAVF